MSVLIMFGCGGLLASSSVFQKGDRKRDTLLWAIYFKLAGIGWLLYDLAEAIG